MSKAKAFELTPTDAGLVFSRYACRGPHLGSLAPQRDALARVLEDGRLKLDTSLALEPQHLI
jgi:hypothetical protein